MCMNSCPVGLFSYPALQRLQGLCLCDLHPMRCLPLPLCSSSRGRAGAPGPPAAGGGAGQPHSGAPASADTTRAPATHCSSVPPIAHQLPIYSGSSRSTRSCHSSCCHQLTRSSGSSSPGSCCQGQPPASCGPAIREPLCRLSGRQGAASAVPAAAGSGRGRAARGIRGLPISRHRIRPLQWR